MAFAILIIVCLIFMFFFSLFNLAESGYPLILFLSGGILAKIIHVIYKGYKEDTPDKHQTGTGLSGTMDPLEPQTYDDVSDMLGSDNLDDEF